VKCRRNCKFPLPLKFARASLLTYATTPVFLFRTGSGSLRTEIRCCASYIFARLIGLGANFGRFDGLSLLFVPRCDYDSRWTIEGQIASFA
jgi:hypothetical protein